MLNMEQFNQIELRVGLVTAAERVESTTKLIRLEVDLGSEQRQMVAGIADWYQPEALVGKRVIVVANLEPARIRGIESNGMILAAGGRGPGQDLGLLTVDKPIPAGTRVE